MTAYELHSCHWLSDSKLEASFRQKSFFAGASGLITEVFSINDFIARFGRQAMPPKIPS